MDRANAYFGHESGSPLKFLLVFSAICLAFGASVLGQNSVASVPKVEFMVERVGAADLSQGMVNDIVEDHEGYVWIATKDGLNRYDGTRIKVYRHDPEDPHSIADNFIEAVFEDSRGRLWVGTYSSGLDLYDRSSDRFIHCQDRIQGPARAQIRNVSQIREDAFGHVIIEEKGLDEFLMLVQVAGSTSQEPTFRIQSIKEFYPAMRELPFVFDAQSALGFSRDSILWYADRSGLYAIRRDRWSRYDPRSARSLLEFAIEPVDKGVTYFLDNQLETVYAIDLQNQVQKLNIKKGVFETIWQIPRDIPVSNRRLFADRDDRIWVTFSSKEMVRLDLKTKQIKRISLAWDNRQQEKNPLFLLDCQDQYGNIWVRTPGFGLLKISSRNDLFHRIPYPEAHNGGMRVSLMGNNAAFRKFPRKWTYFLDTIPDITGGIHIADFTTNSMAVDRYGYFWVSAVHPERHHGYLMKLHPENTTFEIMANRSFADSDWFASTVFSDLKGEIWFSERIGGDSARLFHLDQQQGVLEVFPFPIRALNTDHRFVADCYVDAENRFWLGTKQGLFSFRPDNHAWSVYQYIDGDPQSLSHNSVLTICPDPAQPGQFLWVGTEGGGLNKFNIHDGTFERFTTDQGFSNNTIYAIQSDSHQNLWMSTNMGLIQFDPQSLNMRHFTSRDGLPGNEFNRYQYFKMDDQTLYFGGVSGGVWFHPEDFYTEKGSSKVVINALKLQNEEVKYSLSETVKSSGDFALTAPIERCRAIALPFHVRMISLGFALMDLTNPDGNQFKYKLEGYNDDWIHAETSREATYTNLSPGHYTFKVSGCNSANVWSEPALLEIRILPPWWRTWWFQSLMVICLATGIFALYRFRLKQALKMQHLRNRIAADLHDEIGSTLSSISLAGSVIQQKLNGKAPEVESLVSRIASNTDAMMEAMSDIVWAVNTKNDRFDNVVNRMRAFAIERLEPEQIQLHFHVSHQVDHLKLDMQQRKNLYLLFKEAIHNAAKYARCTEVWVDIVQKGSQLSVRIKDNGQGFEWQGRQTGAWSQPPTDHNGHSMGGNGLYNMYKRTEEMKGHLNITSAKGQGTTIEVLFSV